MIVAVLSATVVELVTIVRTVKRLFTRQQTKIAKIKTGTINNLKKRKNEKENSNKRNA